MIYFDLKIYKINIIKIVLDSKMLESGLENRVSDFRSCCTRWRAWKSKTVKIENKEDEVTQQLEEKEGL